MSNYVQIQSLIDQGLGVGANIIGRPFKQYRVDPTKPNVSMNFLDPLNVITPSINVWTALDTTTSDIEAPKMGNLFFSLTFNSQASLLGDVFYLIDSVFARGDETVNYATPEFEAFALCYRTPLKTLIGARMQAQAYILRPDNIPDATQYFDSTLTNALQVTLTYTNQFTLSSVSTIPALVPVGFTSMPRVGGEMFVAPPDIPDDTGSTKWMFYVPPLPGFTIREGDRIVLPASTTNPSVINSGPRYVVQHPYAQYSGLVGSMLVCTREISQT